MSGSSLNAPYAGPMRQQDGITVFCSDNLGRVRVFIKERMPITRALREIVAVIDSWPADEGWLIDVISTPTTIWRDLQGHRVRVGNTHKHQPFGEDSLPFVVMPESSLLGQIGRKDLLRRITLA